MSLSNADLSPLLHWASSWITSCSGASCTPRILALQKIFTGTLSQFAGKSRLTTEEGEMKSTKVVLFLAVSAILVAGGYRVSRANHQDDDEKYLFVWAGDQSRTKPDFLAVI